MVRVLRVLRVFRVLKLTAYLRESRVLADALWAGRRKIGVFLLAVLTLLVVIGSLMYLVEGEENGFTDIPTSVYWAVVTLTTVGYGDIAPKTPLGRVLAAAGDDPRVRHHRRPDGDRDGRAVPGRGRGQALGMPGVRGRPVTTPTPCTARTAGPGSAR